MNKTDKAQEAYSREQDGKQVHNTRHAMCFEENKSIALLRNVGGKMINSNRKELPFMKNAIEQFGQREQCVQKPIGQ